MSLNDEGATIMPHLLAGFLFRMQNRKNYDLQGQLKPFVKLIPFIAFFLILRHTFCKRII